jgi:AcrR family transcriptional regulator
MDELPPLGVLPRGRHHLTREQVRATQRGRMLLGMVEAVAEKGYAKTTVADVITRARASRETFYEHFANKQECFLAAYEEGVVQTTAALREAIDDTEPAIVRFERVLDVYLNGMAAEPALAHTFLIDVYAAGPDAWKRRADVFDRFSDVVYEILATDPDFQRLPDPRFAARAIVGAISSLVTAHVAAGEYSQLPDLKAPTMQLVTTLVRSAADTSTPARRRRRA